MIASTPPDKVNGTTVSWRDKEGQPTDGATYYSVSWNTRSRPSDRLDGCPQWIRYIAIGDTLEAAQSALTNCLIADTQIASSSRSSKDLQVFYVDAEGDIKDTFVVKHALVPEVFSDSSQSQFPIAKKLWFGEQPFDPKLRLPNGETVMELEYDCNHPPPG